MHKHQNYEIMLYSEGVGVLRTTAGDLPFRKGTVIIVPPGLEHGSVSECGFRNLSVEGEFQSYFHFDSAIALSDNECEEGRTLAELMYDNRYGDRSYLSALCTAYIHFFMQSFDAEEPIRRCIKAVVAEISEHAFDAEIDLGRILRKSGYSEDHIRSRFKDVMHISPHAFLTEVRISHACFLIDVYKRELSLTEIAEQCGYLDYGRFSKYFKRQTGLSPQEYRSR